MSKRYQMTWCKGEGRWRKRYRNKTYNFPAKNGETKEQSYRRCWAEFKRIRAEQDLDHYESHRQCWNNLREAFQFMLSEPDKLRFLEDPNSTLLPGHLGKVAQLGKQGIVGLKWAAKERIRLIDKNIDEHRAFPGLEDDRLLAPISPWDSTEYREPLFVVDATATEATIGGTVARFLESKQSSVSLSRWDILRIALDQFMSVIGDETPIADCDTQLAKYLEHVKARDIAAHTKRDRLQVVRQFFQWMFDRHIIEELPRLLQSREWSVKLAPTQIEIFGDDEIYRLLEASSDRTRLYILLALNCGYTQKDICDLHPNEVDWEHRTIMRKRSKTRTEKNVPLVTYPLWDETFELLFQERSDHPERILTNANGDPIIVRKVTNGKLQTNDNVRSAYQRAARKLDITKPFKLLRKTVSSRLESHTEYSRFGEYFLGHAPTSVKDRHYALPDDVQFRKAVLWLRGEFLGDAPIEQTSRQSSPARRPTKDGRST